MPNPYYTCSQWLVVRRKRRYIIISQRTLAKARRNNQSRNGCTEIEYDTEKPKHSISWVYLTQHGEFGDISIIKKSRRVWLDFHRFRRLLPCLICEQPREFAIQPYYWLQHVCHITQSQLKIKVWSWMGVLKTASIGSNPAKQPRKELLLEKPLTIQDRIRRELLLCHKRTRRSPLSEDQTRRYQQANLKTLPPDLALLFLIRILCQKN